MMRRAPTPTFVIALILAPVGVACSTHGASDEFGADEFDTTSNETDAPAGETSGSAGTSSDPGDPGNPPGGTGDPSDGPGEPPGDSGGDSETGSTGDTDTGAGVTSEEWYLMVCASCHGDSGEGTALGYELQHPVRDYATWVVRNGRPGEEFEGPMMSYGSELVSDEMLEGIWDYLASFPQPGTGEGLFLDYCRNCHGEDASGGVSNRNIGGKGYTSIRNAVRNGKHTDEIGSRHNYMPAWDETELSDDEIHLIADYIASL